MMFCGELGSATMLLNVTRYLSTPEGGGGGGREGGGGGGGGGRGGGGGGEGEGRGRGRELIFLRKSDCLGCVVLLCCLYGLACFILPSICSSH